MCARRGAVALAAIAIGALALRLSGIGFGLPHLYHPDEPAFVLQALAVAREQPNGLTFANPPLFKYLLLAEFAATYALQRAVGLTHSPAEFVDQFRADPTLLYLIARSTSAVLGALTTLAAAALAGSIGGQRPAVIAGLLAAVAFVLVRDAHFGVDDTLVTLLVTLGLIPCVRIAQSGGTRRDYVLAGALSGLAFAAKYDGIALLAPLALAHLQSHRRAQTTHLALAALACGVAAVVAFPSLIFEPGRVLNDIYVHLILEAQSGYDGLDPSGGYVFYARMLGVALGWPLLLAAFAGIMLSFKCRAWASLVVVALPVAMLGVLGSQQLYFARFALPTLPTLIVMASLALEALMLRQAFVGLVALAVVALPTFADSLRLDALLRQTDTRTLALNWVPADATFAADAPPLGPPLPAERTVASDVPALYDLGLEDYRARGAEYLVVDSFTLDARAVDPQREARRQTFRAELAGETLVAEFSPGEVAFAYDQVYGPYNGLDRLERPGPHISIYRLTR